MNDIEFRLAKKSELANIAMLSREYVEYGLGWSWTPERIKKSYLCRDTNILVACVRDGQNGQQRQYSRQGVAGFAIMHYGATEANLNLLAVIPQYRRLGIGKFMVQWLEKSASNAGIDVIYLQCRATNMAAQQFYQNKGWITIYLRKR